MRFGNATFVLTLVLLVTGIAVVALLLFGETAPDPPTPYSIPTEGLTRPAEMGVLSGQVVAVESGAPASGVPVRIEIDEIVLGTETGADGAFRIRVPAGVDLTLRVLSPRPHPHLLLTGVRAVPDRARDLGVLYLGEEFLFRGVVIDTEGGPVAGAKVSAYRPTAGDAPTGTYDLVRRGARDRPSLETCISSADGAVVFRKLSPGSYRFEAEAEGYATGVVPEMIVFPDMGPDALRIVLPPAFSLEGSVRNSEEVPLEAATLDLVFAQGVGGEVLRVRGVVDERGCFELGGLPAGRASLFVRAEGYPLTVLDGVLVGVRDRVEVVLGGTAALEGIVKDREGRHLAGAEVCVAAGQGSETVGRATTDRFGLYRIERLPEGLIRQFAVRKPGYVPYPRGDTVDSGELKAGETSRKDVTLKAGAVVSGKVTLATTKAPVRGAEVRLFDPRADSFFSSTSSAVTDEAGRYRIEGVGEGAHLLVVRASGCCPAGVTADLAKRVVRPEAGSGSFPADAPVITISAGATQLEKDLQLLPGTELSGIVLSPEGEPVAAARVSLVAEGESTGRLVFLSGFSPRAALTNGRGEFRLTGAPRDGSFRLRATAVGHASGETEPLDLASGMETADILIRLRAGGSMLGTVHGSDGKPLTGAGARVVEVGPTADFWRLAQVEMHATDAEGRFRVTGLLPGRTTLAVDAPGHQPYRRETWIRSGETTDVGVVRLEGGLVIAGRVANQQGASLTGIRVRLRGETGNRDYQTDTTDEEGRFRFDRLGPGTYELRIEGGSFAPLELTRVTAGGDELRVTLEKTRISGNVRHPDGVPAAGILVTVGDRQDRSRAVWTDSVGFFEFWSLSAGPYTLTVRPDRTHSGRPRTDGPPGLPKTLRGITGDFSNLSITLNPGLTISGAVIDENGEKLIDARVTAQPVGGDPERPTGRARTNRRGMFSILGVDDGRYRVTATKRHHTLETPARAEGGDFRVRVVLRGPREEGSPK